MKVFISSPYKIGDPAMNVRAQIKASHQLMNYGYTPFLPLLSHFQHLVLPRPESDWLANDLKWLEVCDVVLRLPGESAGADIEVAHAIKLDIPVVYSIDELKNHLQ